MALSRDGIRELAQGFISESDGDCSSIDRAELALQLRAAGDDISDDDVEAVAIEIEGLSLPDIHCEECGRIFTQGTDSGRPDGECPGCGHVNTRAFGVQQGEELVRVENNGIFELYAVAAGTTNPRDAIKYDRIAYWDWDRSMPLHDTGYLFGEWILDDGEPSGNTWRTTGKDIGTV